MIERTLFHKGQIGNKEEKRVHNDFYETKIGRCSYIGQK